MGAYMWVCVCMCVCVCEREREREGGRVAVCSMEEVVVCCPVAPDSATCSSSSQLSPARRDVEPPGDQAVEQSGDWGEGWYQKREAAATADVLSSTRTQCPLPAVTPAHGPRLS